jgi:IclR family pca regulon transcriptional regulator
MTDADPQLAIRDDPQPGAGPDPLAEDLARWAGDPAFMLSLAKGLVVLQQITDALGEPVSKPDLCRRTGLSRDALRRCLYTLEALGFVVIENGEVLTGPNLGAMATSYVRSEPLLRAFPPVVRALRDRTGQSVAFGIFEHGRPKPLGAVYRDDPIQIGVSARDPVPLYCTAIGRVFLAALPDDEATRLLALEDLAQRTERTLTSVAEIMSKVEEARRLGYCLIDQETLPSLRSIAAGVRNTRDETVGWLSITVHTSMLTLKDLRARIAPELKQSALELGRQLP